MKRVAELLLASLVTGWIAFTIGSCGRDAVRDERDTAYKLANHYRWQRDSTAKAQAKTDTVTRTVILTDARLRAQRDSLMSVLTYADSVLADSTASLVTLRVTLAEQVRQTRAYVQRADSLQAYTRDLIAAHALERLATNRTLALADSAIAAWKGVADAERRSKRKMATCAAAGAGSGAWGGGQVAGPWGALVGGIVGGFLGGISCD